MTNEKLKMFIAVAQLGSFRGAAKALHKTQSTISAAVKSLEDQFGILFFDRDSYRPELTLEGKSFYRRALVVLKQVKSLESLGHQMAAGVESEFHIVISGVCPLPYPLSKIKTVMDEFPETEFKVTTEILGGVMERLNSGEAALAITPKIGIKSQHEAIAIDTLSLINVVKPGYIKSDQTGTISQEDIAQYSQIIIRDTAQHQPKMNVNVLDAGRQWSVNDYATKKELTIAGLGWGRLPKHLITQELEKGQLIPFNVEGVPTTAEATVMLVRKRDSIIGPVGSRLWNLFT
ncbi:MAG: LysR family transcriptional regulator [Saccharospirillaceae bacterium]|nr:LysR family transcriptional regulator [Pseudomonadales bacterium]NRB80194.1 LysR family transcriptional regulator [Saccharospirillaceae bacterium]